MIGLALLQKKTVVLKLHQWGVLGNSPNINTMGNAVDNTCVMHGEKHNHSVPLFHA